ncbi:hypothetical protein CLF_106186 [Clonorchis sinensis]|uniref:Uncharacterized protein n=1 Tax=Clonorchis sinensis TaxID=79923 RepID=G7YPS6_CLOSI|nr:hypothetical protein CLF_106186 [Clonorchis sinensis]
MGTGRPVMYALVESEQFAPMRRLFGLFKEMMGEQYPVCYDGEACPLCGDALQACPKGPSSFPVCIDTQLHMASDSTSGWAVFAINRNLLCSLHQSHGPIRDPVLS